MSSDVHKQPHHVSSKIMAFKVPSLSSPKPGGMLCIFSYKAILSIATFKNSMAHHKKRQNRCLVNTFNVIAPEKPEAISSLTSSPLLSGTKLKSKHQKESLKVILANPLSKGNVSQVSSDIVI